ncbi:P0 [Soybean chlorotic leafroll virus]|uniref:P0 n=1 Tax=Soybean chlorotic leafroll virus TaxID=2959664 RepID=A0AAE9MDD1_9VIRU|nr:P0 [Soybean chlorotic leafroll virus]
MQDCYIGFRYISQNRLKFEINSFPSNSRLYFAVLASVCSFFANSLTCNNDNFEVRCFVFLLSLLLRGPHNNGVPRTGAEFSPCSIRQYHFTRLANKLGLDVSGFYVNNSKIIFRISDLEFTGRECYPNPYLQRCHSRSVGARIARRKDVVLGGFREFRQFLATYCRFLDAGLESHGSGSLLDSDIRVVLSAAIDYCYNLAHCEAQFHSRVIRRFARSLLNALGENSAVDFWTIAGLPRSYISENLQVDLSKTFLVQEG